MLKFLVALESDLYCARSTSERGQATAEYAIVLLVAATVALAVLAWATRSGKIAELFDAVVDHLIGKVR